MKNKILLAIIFTLIAGLYIGIDIQRRCVGPLKQRTIRISITKPFVIGYWTPTVQFGVGPAWEDYKCRNYYEWQEKYGNEWK